MLKGRLYQVAAAVACGLGSMSFGMLYVWPSYTLPMLAASNGTILSAPLTMTEEAMLGSLPSLGAVAGTALVAILVDTLGRKWANMFVALFFVISWVMVAFTKSIIVVLLARFLGGMAGGLNAVITPVYISEVAEDKIRGSLATVVVLFYSLGTLVSYFIGWYCSYTLIAWINVALAFLRIVLCFFIPESPLFLLKIKRIEDARLAMSKYRGAPPTSKIVQNELRKIKQELYSPMSMDSLSENDEDLEKTNLTSENNSDKHERKPKFAALKTLFKSPASRRALIVVFISFSMEICMGIACVGVYAKEVFIEADPSQADLYSVILAAIWCGGSLMSGVFADKAGRRILLIGSSVVVAVCMVILGALLQTKAAPVWVPVVIIMVYVFCFMVGAGTMPYVLMSEIFCPEVQTIASIIIIEWMWLNAFFVLALFQWMNSLLGIHVTFYIFAFNSLINVVFSYYLIPETKGLSNKEIQMILLKKPVK